MSIPYRFVPWARRGLARAHQNQDAINGALQTRPRVTVGLQLQAKRDGVNATAVSGNVDLTLYGPADIIGIDPRLIVRTDPKPNATNFEPNYLAIVDFDPPDFPWLLTPARADSTDHLRPWLVLVVVETPLVAPPALRGGQPLPSIKLTAAQVASELPNLNESWFWAHTQAVSELDPAVPAQRALLVKQLHDAPERNISRLVCPRRLEPRKRYIACVVPATDGGRLRGLGQPVNNPTLANAWSLAQPSDIELPVYHFWEFATGPVGDIETLARRLRTPAQYGGDQEILKQLEHIGEQPIAVDGDHLLFNGLTPSRTVFEGAMVSLGFQPSPPDSVFADKLQEMLNSGDQQAAQGTSPADHLPTLSAPIYGEYPAKRHKIDRPRLTDYWLEDLNLQPRYRLAAGWGAEVVRQNQDEFMQAAWAQLGEVLAAERAFSLARLAHDVMQRVRVRHFDRLPPERQLALLAPARARIALGAAQSLYGRMANATLPQELFDGAMRRLITPRRATLRMAQWRVRDLTPPPVGAQMSAMIGRFANASKSVASIDPNRYVPDGLMGSKSYDAVPLPADLATLVDLAPFTGLDLKLTGAEIKAIQTQNATARELASTLKKTAPTMDDVWHKGLITETHAIRVAQLQQATKQPLEGNLAALIQQSSQRAAEGVLLTAQPGGVTSHSLRIDARNGKLKVYGRTLTATRAGRPIAGARLSATTVATVPLQGLKLYGNNAVFTSLPPSAIGQDRASPVPIHLSGPGDFSVGVGAIAGDAPASITLPPAVKDHATLERYSAAFKDYQRVVAPPATSLIVPSPEDFAIATTVAQVRSRANPAQTVPARLASTLSLGGQAVAWSNGKFENSFVSTRLDTALAELLRYVIPRAFDRVMAYPHLLLPLSRKLEKLAPDVFLPGVGALPDDFIMAVKTNPRFVEALMLGANHEMGREMLWRGMPTDQRGTPFQHFWQRLDGGEDITPIHQWLAAPLGKQPASTEMLVLLIRGQLLERFPTLSIYAYPIEGSERRPGGTTPPLPVNQVDPEMDPNKIRLPVMHGHLQTDITYVGFSIEPDDIGKWFFIVQEQMTEPRFGFDEPDGEGQNEPGWLNIDWGEVGVQSGQYFGVSALKQAAPTAAPTQAAAWVNPHAATIADALLQRPFRGYWRGTALEMPQQPRRRRRG